MKAYKDNNTYKLPTKTVRTYYKHVDWTQPVLTASNTLGGDSFACSQSNLYDKEYGYLAFDSSTSTQWTNNGNTGSLTFYNPKPLNVTKLTVMNCTNSTYTRPISSGKLLGSNDNSSWQNIITFTNSNTTAGSTWDIDLSSNTKCYKYYKLDVVGDGSYARIAELTITAQQVIKSTKLDHDFYEDKLIYYGIGD